ncbi:MAG: hypothetical protein AAFU77_04785 [Myxococcota bacterium]
MTSYLASGWFQQDGKRSLRTEIIDGAMDVAGMLARAEVPAHVLMRVALRVRALVAIADPQMVSVARFTAKERTRIQSRLERYTDTSPELYAFVADCVERVDNISDLMAFYLHLIHVARMMQLLDVALHDTLMEQLRGESQPAKPKVAKKKKTPRKKAAKKKTTKTKAKKKPAKTKAKKKVRTKKPAKKKTKSKAKAAAKKKVLKKKTVSTRAKKKTSKRKR